MSINNLVKNVAILLDFIVSIIAGSIRSLAPELSGILFMVSAIILLIAVVCVVIDFISSGRSKG